MSKKPQTSFETNKPFSLRVLYSGHGAFGAVFSYQGISLFQPLSDQQYRFDGKLTEIISSYIDRKLIDNNFKMM